MTETVVNINKSQRQDIDRKIAVIFVTDVVNFSKLMEKNEEETLRSFRACREIMDQLFNEHGGRIFNTAGDSVLAEFQSAVSAVVCANEFQKLVKERNKSVAEDAIMRFRIGLNMGDVIVEGTNLYGEGVNVAARLEAFSRPDGVCLSKSIIEFVNKKTELIFNDLGEQQVKNTSVHAFDLDDPELEKRNKVERKALEDAGDEQKNKPPVIAILPFSNLSNDPEQDYFAEGITEDIISQLSMFRTFPVISNNSVLAYKGSKDSSKKIADELNAKYLVQGSVRKGGNKVRINAKLIDAEQDTQLWSQNWDRSLEDIFEVQDEVSQKVAAYISPALSLNEQKRLSEQNKTNLSAWDECLQSQSYLNKASLAPKLEDKIVGFDKCIEHAKKAIELDENMSKGYNLLTEALIFKIFEPSLDSERGNNEEEYLNCAEKAFNLDPKDPDSLIGKAFGFMITGDKAKYKEFVEKSAQVNPHHPKSLTSYGMLLVSEARYDEAMTAFKSALEIDPASRMWHDTWLTFCHMGKNDWESALESIDRNLRDQEHSRYFGFKAAVLGHQGKTQEAKQWLDKYLNYRPEIKNSADYTGIAPDFNDDIKNSLVEGMVLAGLPKS